MFFKYSECPKCGYHFSWLSKWKLSANKAYPCPGCKAKLLKHKKSEYYIKFSLMLFLLLILTFSILKKMYPHPIPDKIELALVLLLYVPSLIFGILLLRKGFALARFIIVE